ncbi:hypothetical protein BDV24DRAFT_127583 [Aspergillus arachidicola]|uniref:Uncharacterized protein n=1 Tax=Aspergillus arachidicola TaxID=656916 RepID=A0A5N6YI12_9EURO|nr:hypothetical protein BDV24DRAFT_127583 [Aspergillus arachidicola]
MDLRTIMNNDASGTSDAPSTAPLQSPSQVSRKPSDPMYAPRDQQRTSSYPSAYSSHPPQPPPLQRPHASPERSSSYGSLQSPYQYHPPSAQIAGAQSQRGPSPPPYGSSASRDSFSTYGHPQQHHQQQQSPFAQQRTARQRLLHSLTRRSNSPPQPKDPYRILREVQLLHLIPVKRPHLRAPNPPAMNPCQIVPQARGLVRMLRFICRRRRCPVSRDRIQDR